MMPSPLAAASGNSAWLPACLLREMAQQEHIAVVHHSVEAQTQQAVRALLQNLLCCPINFNINQVKAFSCCVPCSRGLPSIVLVSLC